MSADFAAFLVALPLGLVMVFANSGTGPAVVATAVAYFLVRALVAANKKAGQ